MTLDEPTRASLLSGAGTIVVPKLSNLYSKKFLTVIKKLKPNEGQHFRDLVRAIEDTGVKIVRGIGPAYVPSTNRIHLPGKTITPGVLAHEWGHALNAATLKKLGGKPLLNTWGALYMAGHPLSALSSIASLATLGTGASEDTVRNVGLAGAATQAPRIMEELVASARGAAKLRKLNMPGKLKAFGGIPTYLVPAALPMMPWFAKKLDPKLQELLNKKEGE